MVGTAYNINVVIDTVRRGAMPCLSNLNTSINRLKPCQGDKSG